MHARVINVYNNEALPEKGLKSGHGESFHITIGDTQVLFDVGWKGKKLMHNAKVLGINADDIDIMILSHGHRDHTWGLKSFLKARTAGTQMPICAPKCVGTQDRKKMDISYPDGITNVRPKTCGKSSVQAGEETSRSLVSTLHNRRNCSRGAI